MKAHHWVLAAVVIVAAFLLLFATRGVSAADALRGQSLYETHCGGCHGESVHGRVSRVATDYAAIRAWVERWRTTLSLPWVKEEVEDVTLYLNATYYRFPCPPSVCTVVSEASRNLR